MGINPWIKHRLADRALAPLRDQLVGMIAPGAHLLDIGCGTGDLLFRAAPIIGTGLGVDIDPAMVAFANKRRQRDDVKNLQFDCINAMQMSPHQHDVATSSLVLHEMPEAQAIGLLNWMLACADSVLIADFAEPQSRWGRWTIEIDEFFTGHYRQFRHYRARGGIPAYAAQANGKLIKEYSTTIDGIHIWEIQRR